MPIRTIALTALLALLVTSCTSSTHGKATLDVSGLKVTATKPVPASRLAVLSPDGHRVLTETDGKTCVLDIDGSHQVCAHGARVTPDNQYAVWSPDSTRIAFTDDYFRQLNEPDIWVLDAATGAVRDLTGDGVDRVLRPGRPEPKATYDLFPSWSSDSSTIRFARQVGGIGTTIDIEAVPANGGAPHTLGTIGGRIIELAGLTFSPDGKTAAWSMGDNAGWEHSVVHIRDVSGGTDHALSAQPDDGDQSTLSFSPDGQYLLVDSRRVYAQYSCCAKSAALVYPAGGGSGQPVATDSVALFPTWAPTGHALAFTTPMPHASIQLTSAPGAGPRTIQSGHGYAAANDVRLDWVTGALLARSDGEPTLYSLGS